jgi:peptidoglycan/xylan/chitin deacetylase (PgdA/CDA1 family)
VSDPLVGFAILQDQNGYAIYPLLWGIHFARRMVRKAFAAVLRRMTGTITHVETLQPVVALTFDDGPSPESTPRLLEILERHRVRATFFMIGEKAHSHPELVRSVAMHGHEVANHSWDHREFPLLTGRARRSQLRACARAIAPYGHRLFRPPWGVSGAYHLDAFLLRYKIINWSVGADDWCSSDAALIADQLVSRIRPGSIVLLHDGLCSLDDRYRDREPMLKAVEMALERLRGRFQFVTISELLRLGRSQRRLAYFPGRDKAGTSTRR